MCDCADRPGTNATHAAVTSAVVPDLLWRRHRSCCNRQLVEYLIATLLAGYTLFLGGRLFGRLTSGSRLCFGLGWHFDGFNLGRDRASELYKLIGHLLQ